MAPEKAEEFLLTDKRSFQYPKSVLKEYEVVWKTSIRYLGMQLDRRLSFSEHLQIVTTKGIQCGANIAQLMRVKSIDYLYEQIIWTPSRVVESWRVGSKSVEGRQCDTSLIVAPPVKNDRCST